MTKATSVSAAGSVGIAETQFIDPPQPLDSGREAFGASPRATQHVPATDGRHSRWDLRTQRGHSVAPSRVDDG